MTSNAKFHKHIYSMVSRANKMLGFIRPTITRDEHLLPTLKTLYVALVRSNPEYDSRSGAPRQLS